MAGITAAEKFRLDSYANAGPKENVGTLIDAATGTHKIVAAGTFTTLGGDAAETITGLTGVVATDLAFVMLKTEGAAPVTVDAAAAGAGDIDVTMSADPSTDHVLAYIVVRAV